MNIYLKKYIFIFLILLYFLKLCLNYIYMYKINTINKIIIINLCNKVTSKQWNIYKLKYIILYYYLVN